MNFDTNWVGAISYLHMGNNNVMLLVLCA